MVAGRAAVEDRDSWRLRCFLRAHQRESDDDGERLNGVNQQQFTVQNPDFFPLIPTAEQLVAFAVPGSVYRLADNLQAPYTLQSVFSVERQLPHNI